MEHKDTPNTKSNTELIAVKVEQFKGRFPKLPFLPDVVAFLVSILNEALTLKDQAHKAEMEGRLIETEEYLRRAYGVLLDEFVYSGLATEEQWNETVAPAFMRLANVVNGHQPESPTARQYKYPHKSTFSFVTPLPESDKSNLVKEEISTQSEMGTLTSDDIILTSKVSGTILAIRKNGEIVDVVRQKHYNLPDELPSMMAEGKRVADQMKNKWGEDIEFLVMTPQIAMSKGIKIPHHPLPESDKQN